MIHAFLVVKNEADIIVEHLDGLALQVDKIHVLDNDSTDGTRELCMGHPAVTNVIVDRTNFSCSLREKLYRRTYTKEQDWALFIAADQFIEGNLRELVAEAEENKYTALYGEHSMFFYTIDDWDARLTEDIFTSIKDRRLWYSTNFNWMIASKCSRQLGWAKAHTDEWKFPGKKALQRRIVISHYPFRTPRQINDRLKARKKARECGTKSFTHYMNKWVWWWYIFTTEKLRKRDNKESIIFVPIDLNENPLGISGWRYADSIRLEELLKHHKAFKENPFSAISPHEEISL